MTETREYRGRSRWSWRPATFAAIVALTAWTTVGATPVMANDPQALTEEQRRYAFLLDEHGYPPSTPAADAVAPAQPTEEQRRYAFLLDEHGYPPSTPAADAVAPAQPTEEQRRYAFLLDEHGYPPSTPAP